MPSSSKDDRKPAKLSSSKKQQSMDQKSHPHDLATRNGLNSKTNTPSPRRTRRKSDDASSNGSPKKRDLKKQMSVDARSKAGSTGKINSDKKDLGKSPKISTKNTSHSPSKSQNLSKSHLQKSVETASTKSPKQGTPKKSHNEKSRTNRASRTDDDEKDDSDNGSYHDGEDNITTAVSRLKARPSRKKVVSEDDDEDEEEI